MLQQAVKTAAHTGNLGAGTGEALSYLDLRPKVEEHVQRAHPVLQHLRQMTKESVSMVKEVWGTISHVRQAASAWEPFQLNTISQRMTNHQSAHQVGGVELLARRQFPGLPCSAGTALFRGHCLSALRGGRCCTLSWCSQTRLTGGGYADNRP